MAKLTLRPTNGTGDGWSNIANIYDGNQSTSGSVSVSRLNYTNRTLVLNFDTSVIPSGATINSATLTIRSQAGKTTITAYVDINQNSANRVISQKQSTKATNYTADVTSYISDLTSVEVTAHNTNWSGNTFVLYELWIDVDYTESTIIADPPVITILSQDVTKISGVTGHDRCTVSFKADQELTYWEARATTTQTPGHGVGLLVESGTLAKGATGYVYVDDEELTNGDLNYRITIYGRNSDGIWSDE